MTITQDSDVVLCDRTVGSRPSWVAGAFAEMYPDAGSLAADAASVLATDEDWDWIDAHTGAVGAAINHTIGSPHENVGPWLVAPSCRLPRCSMLREAASFDRQAAVSCSSRPRQRSSPTHPRRTRPSSD